MPVLRSATPRSRTTPTNGYDSMMTARDLRLMPVDGGLAADRSDVANMAHSSVVNLWPSSHARPESANTARYEPRRGTMGRSFTRVVGWMPAFQVGAGGEE